MNNYVTLLLALSCITVEADIHLKVDHGKLKKQLLVLAISAVFGPGNSHYSWNANQQKRLTQNAWTIPN